MGDVVRFPKPASWKTFKAMANARHREAVRLRDAGDEEGCLALMKDVELLDRLSTEARVRQERRDTQHRQFAQVLADLIGKLRADVGSKVSS